MKITTIEVPIREVVTVYGINYADTTYFVRERTASGRWKKVSQHYLDIKNAQAYLGRLVIADIEALED